jgi:two-component system, NtrC family, nitrogen regulation response regulator NtrX
LSRQRTILIIDDEDGIRNVLGDVLQDEGFAVLRAAEGPEGLRCLKTELVDFIFLDVWLPGVGGLDVLRMIKEEFPEVPVVMISGHATVDIAVKAVKNGAWDFVEKPLSIDKILAVVSNALKVQELKQENRELKAHFFLEDTMIGESQGMRRVRDLIRQSAVVNSRVMILGENGTGKELVAREIHRQSSRSRKPFVEVNCAAIPDALLESELFGHEKGAFTSAVAQRKGRFEQADTGTLFLDEVADMSLSAQAKVLRAVQEGRFERIGGEGSLNVDVRIISATNKDVPAEVASGRFREDLFYRLNVVPITVPPLRERREDLPLLIEYFFRKFRKSTQGPLPTFTPEGFKVLADHPWPGNIRELKNYLERLSLMVDDPMIGPDEALAFLGHGTASEVSAVSPLAPWAHLGLNDAKDAFERAFIEEKLKENGYNVSRTAQALGLYASNLHTKLKKFAIEVEK